jgi:glycosyltransferase involved in cell wall biosynthesis
VSRQESTRYVKPPHRGVDGSADRRAWELDPESPQWTSVRGDVFVRRNGGRLKIALVDPHSVIPTPDVSLFDGHSIVMYEIARRLARDHIVIAYPRRTFGERRIDYHEEVTYHRPSVFLDRAAGFLARHQANTLDRARRTYTPTPSCFSHYARHVADDIRAKGCDIVHIHGMSGIIPIMRRVSPGARIVLHMYDHAIADFARGNLYSQLRQAALILGCTNTLTRELRDRFPDIAARCHTLHSGVAQRFLRIPSCPAQSRTVLFVGRLCPQKGVHLLLDAFGHVLARHPQADLRVVGPIDQIPNDLIDPFRDAALTRGLDSIHGASTDYLAEIKARAQLLGAGVRFEGPVPNDRIAAHYVRAAVFVCPSMWEEPSGIPVIEAMAAGLPIVATRGGALSEFVVEGETGFLVERGDVHGLAAAIGRLLEDPKLRARMGASGRSRAEGFFTWGHSVSRLNDLYRLALRPQDVPVTCSPGSSLHHSSRIGSRSFNDD